MPSETSDRQKRATSISANFSFNLNVVCRGISGDQLPGSELPRRATSKSLVPDPCNETGYTFSLSKRLTGPATVSHGRRTRMERVHGREVTEKERQRRNRYLTSETLAHLGHRLEKWVTSHQSTAPLGISLSLFLFSVRSLSSETFAMARDGRGSDLFLQALFKSSSKQPGEFHPSLDRSGNIDRFFFPLPCPPSSPLSRVSKEQEVKEREEGDQAARTN